MRGDRVFGLEVGTYLLLFNYAGRRAYVACVELAAGALGTVHLRPPAIKAAFVLRV